MTSEQDQVDEILVTIGTKPEGLYGNVRNRLDILEYRIDPSGISFITTGEFYIDLYKGLTTDITGVPTVVGACYIDTSKFPTNRSVKFRCIIQSSSASATYAAVMDLYDTGGTFGVPAPVTGSQIDNTAVLDPQTATVVEADLTAVFAGSVSGTFEARLWMVTSSSTNVVTCKSAQLVIGGEVTEEGGGGVPVVGYSSQSLVFNGIDEYVSMEAGLGFERDDAFSYSFWIKTTTTTTSFIFAKMEISYKGYGIAIDSTGTLKIYISGGANYILVESASTINDGTWHNVVVTYSGNSLANGVKCYIDNVSDTLSVLQDTLGTDTIIHSETLNIAARADGEDLLEAKIDEVSMWDKELSVAEVNEIYNGGTTSDLSTHSAAANLYTWWRLGEALIVGAKIIVPDFGTADVTGQLINMDLTNVDTDVP